jgi:hypothetical protein
MKVYSIARQQMTSDYLTYFIFSNTQVVSEFQIFEKKAIPVDEMWARCQNCGVKGSHSELFRDPLQNSSVNASINHQIQLSSSWKEIFHAYSNDRYFATTIQPDSVVGFRNLVSHPVYILPMITFHFGHILIDLLEPVTLTIS